MEWERTPCHLACESVLGPKGWSVANACDGDVATVVLSPTTLGSPPQYILITEHVRRHCGVPPVDHATRGTLSCSFDVAFCERFLSVTVEAKFFYADFDVEGSFEAMCTDMRERYQACSVAFNSTFSLCAVLRCHNLMLTFSQKHLHCAVQDEEIFGRSWRTLLSQQRLVSVGMMQGKCAQLMTTEGLSEALIREVEGVGQRVTSVSIKSPVVEVETAEGGTFKAILPRVGSRQSEAVVLWSASGVKDEMKVSLLRSRERQFPPDEGVQFAWNVNGEYLIRHPQVSATLLPPCGALWRIATMAKDPERLEAEHKCVVNFRSPQEFVEYVENEMKCHPLVKCRVVSRRVEPKRASVILDCNGSLTVMSMSQLAIGVAQVSEMQLVRRSDGECIQTQLLVVK